MLQGEIRDDKQLCPLTILVEYQQLYVHCIIHRILQLGIFSCHRDRMVVGFTTTYAISAYYH
jgi:hypothetical protein